MAHRASSKKDKADKRSDREATSARSATGSARRSSGKTSSVVRRNVWLLVLATLLVVGSIILFMPPQEKINQGLDIQGGLSVVLSANSTDGSDVSSDDMEKSRSIIENRVNALGASEAVVQLQGNNQILVQIPGMTDTQQALQTIGKTGKLEFARLDSFTDETVRNQIDSGQYMTQKTVTDDYGNTFPVGDGSTTGMTVEEGTYTPIITGDNITNVTVDRASETSQYYAVNLTLDSAGTQAFADASRDLVGDHGKIVIILDGQVQSAPAVQSEITGGQVSITGNYTLEEAQSLQTVLESGSLPVSFQFEQAQTVGPTLGQNALYAGVMVALIGLLLVMLYLLFFYRGLGLLTAAAMVVFACMYLGLLAALSAFGLFSLSMAGIAGIVLTIGMAADSSILTLERFREEIRMGRSIRAASITGVRHGILTSIDADLVTLVSALTLFFLASASVKGFGLTLALGIFCDIVMMLVFKAPIIRVLAPHVIAKHPGFWGVRDCEDAVPYFEGTEQAPADGKIKGRFIKKDFRILKYRKITLMVALCAVIAVVCILGVKGIDWSIEFVGGTSISFHDTGDVDTETLRSALADAGAPDAEIQTTVTDDEPGFLVRSTMTEADAAAAVAQQVANQFGWSGNSFQVETIGPGWGASVIQSSILAFVVSLLLIILYISARFRDYKMGVCAIVALLHDLIMVFGIYAILGYEVSPNTIAAVLTILGYSLYDTVVVFHRINENMGDDTAKCTFMTMANHSVNEVLVRSLNTSITSLIPVIAMLMFGGETLQDFALAMTIGLVAGCYSSYAIATPLYSLWKTREKKYARLARKYGDEVVPFVLNRLTERATVAAGATAGANAAASAATVADVTASPAKAYAPKDGEAGSAKASDGGAAAATDAVQDAESASNAPDKASVGASGAEGSAGRGSQHAGGQGNGNHDGGKGGKNKNASSRQSNHHYSGKNKRK